MSRTTTITQTDLSNASEIKTDKFAWSDLYKKEDWLAVWIGFIVIALGALSVTTGLFFVAVYILLSGTFFPIPALT